MQVFIEQMQGYFREEKFESLFFMGFGLFTIILGVYWFFGSDKVLKGAAYPLVAVGLIQLVVGSTVYFRTDTQVATLLQQLQNQPTQYYQEELARMIVVNKNFDIYKIIEIVLSVVGLVLIVVFRQDKNVWLGVGLGLALQSLLMLGLDFFAEKRADEYTTLIKATFEQKSN
jgi:drug/metabolite transporter (DMT)-like permease